MKRIALVAVFGLSSFGLPACKKAETTAPEHAHHGQGGHGEGGHGEGGHGEGAHGGHHDFEGREVVDNWRAQPGDVTVCPISGKKFEVDANSGHFSYQGYNFVFCCAGKCLEQVEADPGKYLDALVEEAGGPASDPDPAEGGAIDDAHP